MNSICWKVLLLTAFACTERSGTSENRSTVLPKLNEAKWLLGVWSAESENGFQYEIWHQKNDTIFVAESFAVRGIDTVSLENIDLVAEGDEINYIPRVASQNDGLPVSFKLIFMNETKMIFENQEHDFPQTITYEKINDDSLLAEISGIVKGVPRAKQFPMKRGN